nr:putative reverse transcriptase domain-containing protein [Tanacetum cinerariifolium]
MSLRQRDEKKGKSDRKCFRCSDPSHLIGDCLKTSRKKDQKAFIGGSWSDSKNDAEDKTNDETCLMAQSSNENEPSFFFTNNTGAPQGEELANVVTDALSRKERVNPRRARAMSMTIHSSIKARILKAQSEASKGVNTPAKMLKGLDKQFERKEDGRLYLAE